MMKYRSSPAKSRRWRWLLGIAIFLAAGGYVYQFHFIRDANSAQRNKPVSTVVAVAVEREIMRSLAVSGILVARDEIMVGPQIDGVRLEAYFVDVGNRVKAGDVLARLDRAMLETQLVQNASQLAKARASEAQVKAAIAEAEASEIEAKDASQRASALNTNNISGQTLRVRDVVSARLKAQRENLRLAQSEIAVVEAQRRELELGLTRTDVKAPADGIVSSRSARVGQMVAMAATPLFQIIRAGEVELEADVSEQNLNEVAVGQSVSVSAAGWDKSVEGKVRLVAPTVDQATHTVKVRVALPGSSNLRPGLFVQAAIETARHLGIVVPRSAVLFGSDGPQVQVVADRIAETRRVTIGIEDAEGTEIIDGLAARADVVAQAGAFVRDGAKVVVVRQKSGDALALAP